MTLRTFIASFAAFTALGGIGAALAQEAYVRVVDVGESMCVVARTPTGRTLVYDAGDTGLYCARAVTELVPERRIDLLVLSRIDRDNLGNANEILDANEILTVLHPGFGGTSGAVAAVGVRVAVEGALELDTSSSAIPFGHVIDLGDARVTFIAGWHDGRQTRREGDPPLSPPEVQRQAASIVVRLEYGGHSVLLTGGSVGRVGNFRCGYAEREMVENSAQISLRSDVVISQPGALSLTECFLEAVRPAYAVFTTGLHGSHRASGGTSVRQRVRAAGVQIENIFDTSRTPCVANIVRRDDGPCHEAIGDDDVELWLPEDGTLRIRYRY